MCNLNWRWHVHNVQAARRNVYEGESISAHRTPPHLAASSKETIACSCTVPERPFFMAMEFHKSLLWLHHPVVRFKPVPAHGWVEILHCAKRWDAIPVGAPRFKVTPLWAYAAPGSGTSMNVGRTLVVSSFGEASQVLARLFPGQQPLGCTSCPCDDYGLTGANRSAIAAWRTTPYGPGRVDLSALDSVQIANHLEFFSAEPRHEIVFLRKLECPPDPQVGPLAAHVGRQGDAPRVGMASCCAVGGLISATARDGRDAADV